MKPLRGSTAGSPQTAGDSLGGARTGLPPLVASGRHRGSGRAPRHHRVQGRDRAQEVLLWRLPFFRRPGFQCRRLGSDWRSDGVFNPRRVRCGHRTPRCLHTRRNRVRATRRAGPAPFRPGGVRHLGTILVASIHADQSHDRDHDGRNGAETRGPAIDAPRLRRATRRPDPREERVSATEASRSFSRILDRVESSRGRFLVHRRGREVCVIAPPTCTDGVIHRFGREVGAVYCQASDLTLHSVIRRGVPG